ncbi:hypothetical protein ACLTEW_24465 [Gordonia lacunae]|uniref:hypothetical protein n=1 Tax=Gordonia TaxID=2053 RepID=UPI00200A3664|nr:hypothetical protein [Gordonia terrae]UPW12022.1 hypothetical protein M1C59_25565 [Gordonia terrae]
MLAASAATLSMALSVPGAALADPPPNNADVPSISTTVPQTAEAPGGDTTAPAPETSDELYPGPGDPPASEAPSAESSEVPDPETPGSEVPSSEAPVESSAPSSSESAKPAPDRQSRMAVAAGCQTYPPTSFQVCGRIRDKYNQTGGPTGFLLLPKSNELTNPGNTGKRSEFLGGNIYWSAATDAHPVAHDFLTKWGDYGYETGHMKYPTTDEIVMTGGRRQEFQGAAIYWSPVNGAHSVQGDIRTKYLALGGPGALGWPTTDERITPDGKGRYNIFEKGAIYWSPTTGAHPISGLIQLEWSATGYETGKYGYPTSDPVKRAGVGDSQKFQKGTINLLGRTEADAFYYHTFEPGLPHEFNATDTFGTFDARVHYDYNPGKDNEFYYPMAWGIHWSDYVQGFGAAGGATPTKCKGQLFINGKPTGGGLSTKDGTYTLSDIPHSTVYKNKAGDKKVLTESCSFPDKFGETSIASFLFNYEVTGQTRPEGS